MAAGLRPHATVATLTPQDIGQALLELAALPPGVDAAEIRLDFLWPTVPDADKATDDLLTLVDAARLPLVATLRPKRQGGHFDGPENVRVGLLQAALQAGFQFADVELDVLSTGGVAGSLAQHGGLVASQHLFGETPCRSDGLQFLQSMQDFHPHLDKLAVPVGAFNDALRILEFTRAHAQRGGHPALAPIGLGTVALRALLPFAGNRATYGAANGGAGGVPGQPPLADVQSTWRHWGLDGADLDHLAAAPQPWLAVLGIPVGHSLSPALHNAALRQAGRVERFGALEVPASSSALRLAFHVAPRLGMVGASVTAPHKANAAAIAKPDSVARALGAANCVRFVGESVEATNTDATALARLLPSAAGAPGTALVMGSGGAARAAVHVLVSQGHTVLLASRDATRGRAAAAAAATWVPWENRAHSKPGIIVNATPIGSAAEAPSPLPPALLAGRPLVVEFVYAAGQTRLQRDAAAAGCKVIAGQTLLLEQAVDAFRFWFGCDPDRGAMESALEGRR